MLIVGAPNWTRHPQAAAAADASTPASMPASNVLDVEPSNPVRLLSLNPAETHLRLTFPWDDPPPFDAVAIAGHNLTEAATWRAVARDGANLTWTSPAPDAILAQVNLTGAVSTVSDDPYGQTGTKQTATSASADTDLRVSFGFAGTGLRLGVDVQDFRVAVGTTSATVLAAGSRPTVRVELWEAGGFVATVLPDTPTVGTLTAPETFHAYWDASLLATQTGADVELRIYGTAVGSHTIEPHAIGWTTELGHTTKTLYDSGWLPVPAPTDTALWQGAAALAGPSSAPILFHDFGAANVVEADVVIFMFRDPFNGDGFLELGAAVVGPAMRPTLPPAYGASLKVDHQPLGAPSIGGQQHGGSAWARRILECTFESMVRSEAMSLQDRLAWRGGPGRPVVVLLEPGELDIYTRTQATLYAEAAGGGLEYTPGIRAGESVFQMSWTFTERL